MKRISILAILAAFVLAAPGLSLAQSSSSKTASTTPKKAASTAPAIHATKGVVKSIDASSLVISKVAGKGPDTTFVVNASTTREGTIEPGKSVDVRYRTEGTSKVATAITAAAPKAPAAATTAKPKSSTSTKK